MTDPKEQRLKALQNRFRKIGARQDLIAGMKRRASQPGAAALVFIAFAALLALVFAIF